MTVGQVDRIAAFDSGTVFHLERAVWGARWLVWREDSGHHDHAGTGRHETFEDGLEDFRARVAFYLEVTK